MHLKTAPRVVPLGETVSAPFARNLRDLGIEMAFGVSGGGIAGMWRALIETPGIRTLHFRHEAGAAFAAVEASVLTGGPVAVFCTTGPGLTNTLTGLVAARAEGAKVVLVSARTTAAHRGRGAVQETPMPSTDFFSPGWLFDDCSVVESADELPTITARLQHGFATAGAYVAHVSLPVNLQGTPAGPAAGTPPAYRLSRPYPGPWMVDEIVELMARKRFAIWVGHGARGSSRQVRALVDLTGAPVLATPRGKGVVAEDHPQFLMVTGLGGHPERTKALEEFDPEFTLVLGSRLGEPSSGWEERLIPSGGLVHVDVDPAVPGAAFDCPVLAVQAEIGAFLEELIARADRIPHRHFVGGGAAPLLHSAQQEDRPDVAARDLFSALQRRVVDRGIPVLVEPGSAMAWASNLLVMREPAQLRIVGNFGSMGQMTCGVVGAALARGGPAVCVTGDGSLLMNNEINTAVEYDVPAIWVVLNNSRYQMCEKGMRFGESEHHARFPRCDFAQIARAMGAEGVHAASAAEVEAGLAAAIRSARPFLLDVAVDPDTPAPFDSRFRTLR